MCLHGTEFGKNVEEKEMSGTMVLTSLQGQKSKWGDFWKTIKISQSMKQRKKPQGFGTSFPLTLPEGGNFSEYLCKFATVKEKEM